jgi:hypothetical protein
MNIKKNKIIPQNSFKKVIQRLSSLYIVLIGVLPVKFNPNSVILVSDGFLAVTR